jgi:hypothetical protein
VLSGAKVTLDLLGKASGPNLKAFADHLVTRLPDERIDPDKVVAAIGKTVEVALRRGKPLRRGMPPGIIARILSTVNDQKDEGRGKKLRFGHVLDFCCMVSPC